MTFKHKLSQLILDVTAGDGVTTLEGMTVKIENLKADGSMDLKDGTVTLGSKVATLNPAAEVEGASGKVAAILVPGQDLSNA
ncbi:MAG: fimbrillin family protein, partial [Fastidiosipila sp.]|nr:fimbrillin family protein [Fastidiosipila sp.]